MRGTIGLLILILVGLAGVIYGIRIYRLARLAARRCREAKERTYRDGMICIRCGYNMRASPTRCSECGYEPQTPA